MSEIKFQDSDSEVMGGPGSEVSGLTRPVAGTHGATNGDCRTKWGLIDGKCLTPTSYGGTFRSTDGAGGATSAGRVPTGSEGSRGSTRDVTWNQTRPAPEANPDLTPEVASAVRWVSKKLNESKGAGGGACALLAIPALYHRTPRILLEP